MRVDESSLMKIGNCNSIRGRVLYSKYVALFNVRAKYSERFHMVIPTEGYSRSPSNKIFHQGVTRIFSVDLPETKLKHRINK